MLFAAFDKKWWKGLMKDEDEITLTTDSDSDLAVEELSDSNGMPTVEFTSNEESEIIIEKDAIDSKSTDQEEHFLDESSVEEDLDFQNEEEVEESETEVEEVPKSSSKKKKSGVISTSDFFKTEILYRFDLLEPKHRDILQGKTEILLEGDSKEYWLLNIDSNDIEISSGTTSTKDAELKLNLRAEDFIQLVNGRLNPQIALISKRIGISGDSKKASLLQNLLSPVYD